MLTFEDLERMPDDAQKHELLEGELVVTPPPGIDHSEIAHRLQDELRPHVKGRGRVYIEAGFQMGTRNCVFHTGTLTTPVFPDLRLEVQALFG